MGCVNRMFGVLFGGVFYACECVSWWFWVVQYPLYLRYIEDIHIEHIHEHT